MIALDRATLDPSSVRDPVQAPLATSAQIDMVLKQRAQKLPPHRLELSLQLGDVAPSSPELGIPS